MADDIQERIKKMPPFDNEETPTKPQEEAAQETSQEETPFKPQEENAQQQQEVKEENQQEADDEVKQEDETKLPDDVKERTKQEFEKLKKRNQELKEALKKQTDVLTSLQPEQIAPPSPPNQFTPYFEPIFTNKPPAQKEFPSLSQEQINETFDKLVDDQGYVDVNLLKEELRRQQERARYLEQKAKEAEELARQAKKTVDDFQRTEYMRKIHQKYPQIDPESPKFDKRMWEAVRNEIIGQWTTQGKEDVEAAAEKWLNILYPNMSKDREADKKAQINAVSPKPASTSQSWEDHEALVEATRKGKKGALIERLKRAGY